MSAVTVTIIKSGRTDPYGNPLVVGQSYSLDTEIAKSLLQAGYASVVDPVVFDDDSLSQGRVIATCLRFPGFKPSLLASLAASSTASRTANVVTVSATGHGITTGTTYVGFRFYYPGSTNLAAGWYSSILTIPDANTVTFSATGDDFTSESINSGAAWTTATDILTTTIQGGVLRDQSKVKVYLFRDGSTTGGTKTIILAFGGSLINQHNLTTTPRLEAGMVFRCLGTNKQVGSGSGAEGIPTGTAMLTTTKDITVDQVVTIRGTLSAASEFIAIFGSHVEITQ